MTLAKGEQRDRSEGTWGVSSLPNQYEPCNVSLLMNDMIAFGYGEVNEKKVNTRNGESHLPGSHAKVR